jgi:hypothetical protein
MGSLVCGSADIYAAALKTIDGGTPDSSGTYTVIRYSDNSYDDAIVFAIIVPEKGRYAFDIYKPGFDYKSAKGLTAKQAMDMAQAHVSTPLEFLRSQTSSIIGPEGKVIGYEVRALYKSIGFGMQDVMNIDYYLKGANRVEVRIRVDDEVIRRSMGGDDHGRR